VQHPRIPKTIIPLLCNEFRRQMKLYERTPPLHKIIGEMKLEFKRRNRKTDSTWVYL